MRFSRGSIVQPPPLVAGTASACPTSGPAAAPWACRRLGPTGLGKVDGVAQVGVAQFGVAQVGGVQDVGRAPSVARRTAPHRKRARVCRWRISRLTRLGGVRESSGVQAESLGALEVRMKVAAPLRGRSAVWVLGRLRRMWLDEQPSGAHRDRGKRFLNPPCRPVGNRRYRTSAGCLCYASRP
jgi:hypothetical protein